MIEIILFILLWLIMFVLTMIGVLYLYALAFFWLIENEPDKKIKNWLIKPKQRR